MTSVYSDPTIFGRHLQRAGPDVGLELPRRVHAVHSAVLSLSEQLTLLTPRRLEEGELFCHHPFAPELKAACERLDAHELQSFRGSGDLMIDSSTFTTALYAVGAVRQAVDQVMKAGAINAFVAQRPPSHHASELKPEGFCFFNSVAIAARYLIDSYGLNRVAIVDIDLHHGNGTQAFFEEDPRVYFFSTHGDPKLLYPQSGFAKERGRGAGRGFTMNVPLAQDSDDDAMRDAYATKIIPELRGFAPEFILVSAGFDAHKDDPFRFLRWEDSSYRDLTKLLCETAEAVCGGRLVSVLEGGYSPVVLERVVKYHLRELIASEARVRSTQTS